MVYIVTSVDGELVTDLTFINEKEGLEWIDRMENIETNAAILVREFPVADTKPTDASQRAIAAWLRLVQASRGIGPWPKWYISPSIRKEEAAFKKIFAHPESRLVSYHDKLVHFANQKQNDKDE
jgi:hypothetical protein